MIRFSHTANSWQFFSHNDNQWINITVTGARYRFDNGFELWHEARRIKMY